jgi:hypothetical protein
MVNGRVTMQEMKLMGKGWCEWVNGAQEGTNWLDL